MEKTVLIPTNQKELVINSDLDKQRAKLIESKSEKQKVLDGKMAAYLKSNIFTEWYNKWQLDRAMKRAKKVNRALETIGGKFYG